MMMVAVSRSNDDAIGSLSKLGQQVQFYTMILCEKQRESRRQRNVVL